jgi:hypothetical protein
MLANSPNEKRDEYQKGKFTKFTLFEENRELCSEPHNNVTQKPAANQSHLNLVARFSQAEV